MPCSMNLAQRLIWRKAKPASLSTNGPPDKRTFLNITLPQDAANGILRLQCESVFIMGHTMTGPTPTQAQHSNRRRILLTVLLLAVVLIVIIIFLFTESIRSAPIPLGVPPGDVTFISNQGGSWDILMLGTDGAIQNLSAEAEGPTAQDYFGSWAMDSARMNFLSSRAGELAPTQVEPDGSNPRTLDILRAVMVLFGEGRLDWDPAWSPGGSTLVWSSLRDFNLELYKIDTAAEFSAQNATRLTNSGARDWFAAWSPDGTKIAFASDRNGSEDVFVLDVESLELTQLTDDPTSDIHPVWSMDGEEIVFATERRHVLESGMLDLYIMNADGSNQRPLTDDIAFEGDPTWSPDGQQVLYMSNQGGDWNIFIRNADGSGLRRLTDSDADELFPVWRP